MHVLVVQFEYTIPNSELEATADEIAAAFATIPGCLEKTWIHDRHRNAAGGIYKFRDEPALDAYLVSELWAGVESDPAFVNMSVRKYEAMEGPSAVTGGIPQLARAN